eukprot:gnl/MRDRNA2_/MRDRNA2_87692_c0_seq1.p1 gnl/MRDRNA2_/MRDRNA2_87692_c0~~gnl/MRDRNA2_/MRDRNA2_87692_c0_seq1.p1  ORF type:complete len:425 (+),score=121.43 gnl/MRDRNA2_/MRDRNA2_87692_c0_seq1:73-1275(+)
MAEDGWTPLSHEILCKSLSLIDKTVEGSGYVFTKLDCSEKELTHLGNKVQEYKHLKYVTLSKNQVEDLEPVSKLPHCLCLVASENKINQDGIKCMVEADLPFCQVVDLSMNQLTGVFSFSALARLRVLDLQENQIASLEGFDGHKNIEILKLQKNQLETLQGLGSLPKLQKLFVSENKLTSLEGLAAETLEELDASQNQLASMDFVDGAPNIRTLNITGNQYAGDDDLPEFKKVATTLPILETLLVASNPLCDTFPEPRKEILLVVPGLQKIDDKNVDNEEREACVQLMKVRAEEKAEMEKKLLTDQLEEILEKLPEEAGTKIREKDAKNKEEILAEFPPPPEPSGDDADADAEPPPKPDPMPKLLREIELQKELLQMASAEAASLGVGLEDAAPPEADA